MKKHFVGTAHDKDIGADIIFGTVVSVSPLKITVDSSLSLDGSRLIVPSYLYGENFSVSVDGVEHEGAVKSRIQSGAHVCMIRASGGQKYAVIGIID